MPRPLRLSAGLIPSADLIEPLVLRVLVVVRTGVQRTLDRSYSPPIGWVHTRGSRRLVYRIVDALRISLSIHGSIPRCLTYPRSQCMPNNSPSSRWDNCSSPWQRCPASQEEICRPSCLSGRLNTLQPSACCMSYRIAMQSMCRTDHSEELPRCAFQHPCSGIGRSRHVCSAW